MKVAIMSHNRHHSIGDKTLKLMDEEGFDPADVTIFVHNEQQKKTYEDYIDKKWNVVVGADHGEEGQTGYTKQFGFMFNYYEEGTDVIFSDDDIAGMLVNPKCDYMYKGLKKFCEGAFAENARLGCHLWGLYPSANAFFLQDTVSYELNLIIGQFYGMRIRHEDWITVPMKTDYELTIKHYIKDGMVCRYNWLASKSKVYAGKGGLQTPERAELSREGANLLLSRYPQFVKRKKSKGKFDEISLKKLKKR
ncbi:MAG: hypothetical protein CMF45_08605 [Legionellales bacterium]|nr:hypothetical protein [Legionellales bacterium]